MKMNQMQSQNPQHQVYLFFTLNILNDIIYSPSLQSDVKSPKSTRHSCPVTWSHSGGQPEIKTVELVIETTPANIPLSPMDKSYSGNLLLSLLSELPNQQFFIPGKIKMLNPLN